MITKIIVASLVLLSTIQPVTAEVDFDDGNQKDPVISYYIYDENGEIDLSIESNLDLFFLEFCE